MSFDRAFVARDVALGEELFRRARQFRVTVEPGSALVKGPYVAETFAVSVEEDYLVVDLAAAATA